MPLESVVFLIPDSMVCETVPLQFAGRLRSCDIQNGVGDHAEVENATETAARTNQPDRTDAAVSVGAIESRLKTECFYLLRSAERRLVFGKLYAF